MNNQKGISSLIGIVIVVAVAIIIIGGVFGYQYLTQPKESTGANNNQNIVGGDRDEHGCIGSAGYSWCEAKQKCLRTWEEPCEAVTTDQTAGLKTYNSNLYGFTLEYPNVLTLESTDSEFSLYHSVPFKHSNPCNLKDGASIDVIIDFNVTGTIENGNINNVLRSENYYGINFDSNGKPIIDENSGIKEFKNVNLIGYYYSMGVEGCGVDVYYFSLKNNKTLVLRDIWVGEFSPVNGYTGQYDKLAGVILPDKHSVYLNQILSTFKFIK